MAAHRLLQSITRMDYHCCNKPIAWETKHGTQKGFYHPMDLLHHIIKTLEIPLRSKLYRKLADCKIAVPVVSPDDERMYIDLSLRSIRVAWLKNNQLVESDVTTAPLPIVSMIRFGDQSAETISKSKLANAILKFSTAEDLGSFGFFRKSSRSSNNYREVSSGIIEGIWYQDMGMNCSTSDLFPTSFGLLNLRGDSLNYPESFSTLASISDVLFFFCDNDMFEEKNSEKKTSVFEMITKKLKETAENGQKIHILILIITKVVQRKVLAHQKLFKVVSDSIALIVANKTYHDVLNEVTSVARNALKELQVKSPKALSHRLEQRNKESNSTVNNSFKQVSESLTKYMNMIYQANNNDRSKLRAEPFPLQSSTKHYAEAQRKGNRSRDYQERKNSEENLISIRKGRYTKIREGFPKLMSQFLNELLTTQQTLIFIQNVQYNLDDWYSKRLFDICRKYRESLKKSTH